MFIKIFDTIKTIFDKEPALLGLAAIALLIYASFLIYQYFDEKEIRENIRQDFDNTAKGLFSEKLSERICSAILLRRFLNKKNKEGRGKNSYRMEAINVISSLLKIEKCDVFQKTLADSLSYTENFDEFDFQNCNFQNMCLIPNKVVLTQEQSYFKKYLHKLRQVSQTPNEIHISMCRTDFFMADFSYATLNYILAKKAVFYKSNMHRAVFKNSNLSDVNFYEAYASGVKFSHCVLDGSTFSSAFINSSKFIHCSIKNVDFSHAHLDDAIFENCQFHNVNFSFSSIKNISFITTDESKATYLDHVIFFKAKHTPKFISKKLQNHVFSDKIPAQSRTINTQHIVAKRVFLSCSGALSPKQSEFTSKLKHDLQTFGIELVFFDRTKYRLTGQISSILTEIAACHGVISLGFKDIEIKHGIYRPQTEDMTTITDKIMTSPWINIEMGLAIGIRKPMLILYDGRICDGLIDPNITDLSINKINFTTYNYADYEYEIRKWALNLDPKNLTHSQCDTIPA